MQIKLYIKKYLEN